MKKRTKKKLKKYFQFLVTGFVIFTLILHDLSDADTNDTNKDLQKFIKKALNWLDTLEKAEIAAHSYKDHRLQRAGFRQIYLNAYALQMKLIHAAAYCQKFKIESPALRKAFFRAHRLVVLYKPYAKRNAFDKKLDTLIERLAK